MGYRIRVVPEVEAWLSELREDDPGAADLVDDALDALREGGAGLGPPLVVPVEAPAHRTRPDLDYSYQRQLEMLTRVRRGVADVATARKRLEVQIYQLEETVVKLREQHAQALDSGDDPAAALVQSRSSTAASRLADLRRQYADMQSEEGRLATASQRLQAKVDNFRSRKEAIKAANAVAEAAAEAERAEAMMDDAGADRSGPEADGPADVASAISPAGTSSPETGSPELSELRPGAPGPAGVRILFTVEPPDTAVLLAAGTERDWLRAWYAEAILHCRARYERDQAGTS
jgi:hypothetical protein